MSIFTVLVLVSTSAFAQLQRAQETTNGTAKNVTNLKSAKFHAEPHELSGLSLDRKNNRLLAVTDTKTDHPSIFELSESQEGVVESKLVADLSTFTGYSEYVAQANALPIHQDKKFQVFDFEGITQCSQTIYLANERIRQIVVVNLTEKNIQLLPIDFSTLPKVVEGGLNAGFEGVSADCKAGLLYIAKERAPRQILVINLKTNQIQDQFTIEPSKSYAAEVAQYNSSKPKLELGDDFADLTFDGGSLYILERNAYEITKVDPNTKSVVSRINFRSDLISTLYNTNEPFGLAEGLALSKKEIYIAFDNNEAEVQPSQIDAVKPPKKNSSLLLTLKRPKGF